MSALLLQVFLQSYAPELKLVGIISTVLLGKTRRVLDALRYKCIIVMYISTNHGSGCGLYHFQGIISSRGRSPIVHHFLYSALRDALPCPKECQGRQEARIHVQCVENYPCMNSRFSRLEPEQRHSPTDFVSNIPFSLQYHGPTDQKCGNRRFGSAMYVLNCLLDLRLCT